MKLIQLPYLASAAAMTLGLYLLAGPLRADHTEISRLVPVWLAFTAYELAIIGAIHLLRKRKVETLSLSLIALFFLADPVFLSNSFAAIEPAAGFYLNLAGWTAALLKGALLMRATGFNASPWQVGWAAAALGFIHLFPSLIAGPAAQPADFSNVYWAGLWVACGIAVPLLRMNLKIARGVAGALLVHTVATGLVVPLDFHLHFLTPPLLAAAFVIPWTRFAWIPAGLSVACSPLRPLIRKVAETEDGIGIALIAAAFVLLGVGVLRSLASSRRARPVPEPATPPRYPASSRPGP